MRLNDYRKSLTQDYEQFVAQHKIADSQIHENVRYEKLENVIRLDIETNQFFFVQGGKLKMIYISDDLLAKQIWDEFKNIPASKSPEKMVRSRAGKTSNQLIFAGQGITASIANDRVDFIEIYTPCSLNDYLESIYREVQFFIR